MNSNSDKRTCITGAQGFIGSHLHDYLSQREFKVSVWSRSDTMNFENCGSVVHLAGRAHRMHENSQNVFDEYKRDNADLTVKIAEEALNQCVKLFIYISTVKVAGELPGNYRIDQQVSPTDPYGRSKKLAEDKLERLFNGQSNAKCVVLRLPMVYGPGNKGNMISLLKAAKRKIPLPLKTARRKRSLIYVSNVCDAIYTILCDSEIDRPHFQKFYISDEDDISSGELYSLIYEQINNSSGIFYIPEYMIRMGGSLTALLEKLTRRSLPINKAMISRLLDEYRFSKIDFCQAYGWKPMFQTALGIKNTVEWYLETH